MQIPKLANIGYIILTAAAIVMAPTVHSKPESTPTLSTSLPLAYHLINPPPKNKPIIVAQVQETCFLKGEKTDGMNKTCFYSCLSGEAAITISSTSLCPLNIKR